MRIVGTGAGAVAVCPPDTVVVADEAAHCVRVCGLDDNNLKSVRSAGVASGSESASVTGSVRAFGSWGDGCGQCQYPTGVAVHGTHVYVLCRQLPYIQVFE